MDREQLQQAIERFEKAALVAKVVDKAKAVHKQLKPIINILTGTAATLVMVVIYIELARLIEEAQFEEAQLGWLGGAARMIYVVSALYWLVRLAVKLEEGSD